MMLNKLWIVLILVVYFFCFSNSSALCAESETQQKVQFASKISKALADGDEEAIHKYYHQNIYSNPGEINWKIYSRLRISNLVYTEIEEDIIAARYKDGSPIGKFPGGTPVQIFEIQLMPIGKNYKWTVIRPIHLRDPDKYHWVAGKE